MKELDTRVNIIPVIAKADTISRPDLIQFKKQVSIKHTIRITGLFSSTLFLLL